MCKSEARITVIPEFVHLLPSDLLHKGGNWLAAVREWIQHKIPNGEYIHWGTDEVLGSITLPTMPYPITVKMVEEIGAEAAAAVYNEIGCGPDEIQRLRNKVKMAQDLIDKMEKYTKDELHKLNDIDVGGKNTVSDLYGEVLWTQSRLKD